MEKGGLIFFAFLALQLLSSSSQDTSKWLSIDCGNDEISFQNLLTWKTDSDYIQVGSNKPVLKKTARDEFNTLRAFPNISGNISCYTLPTEKQKIRYIIRAGFYYGNYDGLSRPPVFNLYINSIYWESIDMDISDEPFYKEIIYQNKESGFLKICLEQIENGGIPFINSIETMVVFNESYPKMENNATYNLVTRMNLGGPEVRYDVGSDEIYNRIWSKKVMPDYDSFSGFPNFSPTPENHPPITVLRDGIGFNAIDPLTLTIDISLQNQPQSVYIVLYMTNLGDLLNPNQSARVKIEINNQDQGMVEALHYGETAVITKYPVIISDKVFNITLSPADEASLPPMISAMEVFAEWEDRYSAAAPKYYSFACSLILIFMLLSVA